MPTDPLALLMERFLAEVARLGETALRTGNYARWASDFQQQLVDYHLASYFLGKDESQLSSAAEKILNKLIGQQITYAKKFGALAGSLSDDMFLARSSLYAGALKAAYSRAKWANWPLPFHPTEKCECMVNCQCHWEGQSLDSTKGNGDFVWKVGQDAIQCPTCQLRHEGNPYLIRGGKYVFQAHTRARHAAAASEEPKAHR